MRLPVVIPLVVAFAVAALPGCAKKEEPKPVPPAAAPGSSGTEEGKALFERKCGACHEPERAVARPETRERWAEIIKDMRGRRSDWISDEEAAKILEYLAAEHGK